MRTLEEILEMLREAAEEVPEYFEIGPEESRLLWAEVVRLRARAEQGGKPMTEVWIRCTHCGYQWHWDNCPVGDLGCLRCSSSAPLLEVAEQKPDWWAGER